MCWPNMAHIISSCKAWSRIGHTAMPYFNGKEKQILQSAWKKVCNTYFFGGACQQTSIRALSGWVECGISWEGKWHSWRLQGAPPVCRGEYVQVQMKG